MGRCQGTVGFGTQYVTLDFSVLTRLKSAQLFLQLFYNFYANSCKLKQSV